jgi:Family of unknown function (DUF5941)
MTVAAAVSVLPRRMAGWAARWPLAPNALTGIGLAASLCAAVWFTAGTRTAALAGGLALCAGYLARRVCAQLLVALRAGAATRAGLQAVPPGPVSAGLGSAGLGSAGLGSAELAGFDGWLAAVGAASGELAVYAGLAAGAVATQRHGIWVLAAGAAITLSIGQAARLCQPSRAQPPRAQPPPGQPPPAQPPPGQPGGAGVRPRRWPLSNPAAWILSLPAGGRAAVIALTAPFWGARISFLALIAAGTAAALWAMAAGGWAVAAGGRIAGHGGIAACRDDGPFARMAGRIVQGQLVPLPAALAGLAATALLAGLGLGNLPGILVPAPVAVMLLAASGASHPHDGGLDWLVPLVLLAGQYVYLAALGFAAGVPGPVTFALVGAVALHQLDVACRARQRARWPAQRAGMGWDGRIAAAGFGALLGIATFAYLALTAYLGWLLCKACLSGWLYAREPDIPANSEGERR